MVESHLQPLAHLICAEPTAGIAGILIAIGVVLLIAAIATQNACRNKPKGSMNERMTLNAYYGNECETCPHCNECIVERYGDDLPI